MYILDNKIFIHIVKCGGSSIREGIYKNRRQDLKFCSEHFPIKLLNEKYKNYDKITIIREPISWYKSFYNYTIQMNKNKGSIFNALANMLVYKDNKRLPFRDFVINATNLELFFKDRDKIKILINKIRNGKFSKSNYFNLIFDDYTDENEFVEKFSSSCYQFFINSVGGFDVDRFYHSGDDLIYDEFNINKRKKNQTKTSLVKDSEITEEIKNLIHKYDHKVYEHFNIKKEL
ncbi:MAG: hypothetical protein DRG78_11230 [Epsilonproteobacteria bacterium]|nr:MAG: hypothetical protein DRG78_11230 [Campylobacterota bacterium]